MNDIELQQKVDDLRRQLNDGNYVRTRSDSTSSTSGDFIGDNPSVDSSKRRTSENLRTTDSRTQRGKATNSTRERSTNGTKRVTKTVLTGVGQTIDGHEQDNSSSDTTRYDNERTATRGRLIRDESDAPTRKENINPTSIFIPTPRRKPGRPKKSSEDEENSNAVTSTITRPSIDQQVAKRFNWFSQSNTISDSEAQSLLKPLGAAFVDYGGYIDEYARIKMGNPSLVFFSDLSYQEGEVLAKVILRLGKVNPQVATATRTLIDGNDYLSAIIILWPRIMKLVQALNPDGLVAIPQRQARERKPGLFYRPPTKVITKEKE